MENNEFISLVVRRKYRILAFLFIFIFLIIFLQFGFIEVEISSGSSGGISYRLQKQGSNQPANGDSSSNRITKLVSRGSYEVLITQGDKSAFNVAKVRGFFIKTKISSRLEQEKDRQFVGNNPSPCVFYADTLYSYDCNGSFNEITRHVPATGDTPTYTDAVNTGQGGDIEGIINTKGGRVALISYVEADDPQNAHVAYQLNNFTPANSAPLKDLSPDKAYLIKPYLQGFIAYADDYTEIYYYQSISSAPQQLTVPKPQNKSLRPYALDVNDKSLLVAYSDIKAEDVSDEVDSKLDKSTTTFVVWDGTSSKEQKVDYTSQQTKLCGQNICALSQGTLHVLERGRAKDLFKLEDVDYIENAGNSFIVARNHEVINLDTTKKGGFIEVSLGDYKNCGISPDKQTSYILCLINNKNKKVALRVDQNAPNKGSIDKKVAQLQKQKFVTDVSINGRYIFISPNVGEPTYQEQTKSYDYDPATVKSVTDKINSEIAKLGIDTNNYTISQTIK
jgi:hypothetical protein